MMLLGARVRERRETPELLAWVEAYVELNGHAPFADDIYVAANFSQPGGIGRLCAALEIYGAQLARSRRAG